MAGSEGPGMMQRLQTRNQKYQRREPAERYPREQERPLRGLEGAHPPLVHDVGHQSRNPFHFCLHGKAFFAD